MNQNLAIAILSIGLASCGPSDPYHYNNPEIAAKYFEQCMNLLPDAPAQTTYNDWDEVVHECRNYANSQALQSQRTIKESHDTNK